MKATIRFLVTVAVLLSALSLSQGLAQQTQASYTVNLSSFTLQVTYPSEVMPGQNITVNVQASPKTTGTYLQTLAATVYYGDTSGLHALTTQTLVSNAANGYGSFSTGSFSKNFTVNIPQNAPRTSLVAIFSETVQSNNYNYYNYPSYFGYLYNGNPLFYSNYPSYSTTTDDAIAPLSYVKATTPEYVTLQSEYQMLQQQLNQTQAQNQQLQTTISQQSATISLLSQQLASVNSTTQTYQGLALVAVIIAVALAAFAGFTYYKRSKGKDQAPTPKQSSTKKAETETAE
ncbi:MAG: hypothetical protein ABSF63_03800 [Candidatus Bathyarchaeia archaeon]